MNIENMILAQLVEDLVPEIKRYRKQILVFHNSSGLLSNCLKILRKYGRKRGINLLDEIWTIKIFPQSQVVHI